MKRRWHLAIALSMLLVAAACSANNASTPAAPQQATAAGTPQPIASSAANGAHTLGRRSKVAGCQVNGALPDSACTPGVAVPGVTSTQVCTPGYARSVRDVPESEKIQVYAEYGIRSHTTGQYEVDHLVSLEIGGSNDIANLWPEAASPSPGFHDKDSFENYLHEQVCRGAMSLDEAQYEIATDWLRYWTEAGKPGAR